MRFCLVSPASIVEFDPDLPESKLGLKVAEHMPLGTLTVAAVLEELEQAPRFVDLNDVHLRYRNSGLEKQGVSLCEYALEELCRHDFEVIGLGTICSSYPLTLRLAEGIRRRCPDARIVLGGPQASVVDVATLEHFPAVDVIVRGEAEQTLPALLEAFGRDRDLAAVAGITFRRRGETVQNPQAPLLADLDDLPFPAYHLYPLIERAKYLPLELGRGCPYACSFCSTNDFFRRQFRLKTPGKVLAEMRRLESDYGIDDFDLIHDMFTVDRKKVVAFCEAMIASGEGFRWHCSARTDRVDEALLALMARAGCRGIFFGIETGSAALQKKIKKRLDLDQARAHIRFASDAGMTSTVSLITCFPEETESDFRDTVDFFVDALRSENASPQLHILAPLAATPIHRRFEGRLELAEVFSDLSRMGFEQDPSDQRLIADFPDLFPNFYAAPTNLSRPHIAEVRGFLLGSTNFFRWLLVALHQEPGGLLAVFRRFQDWRDEGSTRGVPRLMGASYYRTPEFRSAFIDFVRRHCLGHPATAPAISALVKVASFLESEEASAPPRCPAPAGPLAAGFEPASIPRHADGIHTFPIGVDYPSLMHHLTDRRRLDQVRLTRQQVVFRKTPGKDTEVVQLSGLLGDLLESCDGKSTVAEISERLAVSATGNGAKGTIGACRTGLAILQDQGFIACASRND